MVAMATAFTECLYKLTPVSDFAITYFRKNDSLQLLNVFILFKFV